MATCPEEPEGRGNLLRGVYERVMVKLNANSYIRPLTVAQRWQIRRDVWASSWFGALQFEGVVLLLWRCVFEEVLALTNTNLTEQRNAGLVLRRMWQHVVECRDIQDIMGENFVPDVIFKRKTNSTEGRKQYLPNNSKSRHQWRGDLLLTFDSISVVEGGDRHHEFSFWGTPHLYDLPDGLFATPVSRDQLRVISFLTTLHWHSKSKAILPPGRNEAFGQAVSWAIRERELSCIKVLLALWVNIRRAGNDKMCDVVRHVREGLATGDWEVVEHLCCGFQLPFSTGDLLHNRPTGALASAFVK
ncbi:uncharacterized protein AB675_4255 [Cyphellophora attinorum]|uniref:Uncharacterized protein n=1 Tax=Cyphellophora attinorum TaxID=1664694 RepID=A0A0N1NZL7_9EURO|nr:uncharacterized protein AB675_4255 [Phialophora attinorum]KPI38586.1 hypothetical protein AB675_4255 [Phialophora attinorum]